MEFACSFASRTTPVEMWIAGSVDCLHGSNNPASAASGTATIGLILSVQFLQHLLPTFLLVAHGSLTPATGPNGKYFKIKEIRPILAEESGGIRTLTYRVESLCTFGRLSFTDLYSILNFYVALLPPINRRLESLDVFNRTTPFG